MAHSALNTYSLVFYRKSLLTPGINELKHGYISHCFRFPEHQLIFSLFVILYNLDIHGNMMSALFQLSLMIFKLGFSF